MRCGLAQLIDPRLLPLVDPSRDFYAQRVAGRGPSSWEQLRAVRAGTAPDRTDPDVSPIYAELAGLPPVLLIVGEDDVLLQDNLAMAARLSAAGVDVDLRIYPGSPHAFTAHPTPMAQAARDDIETWLSDRARVATATQGATARRESGSAARTSGFRTAAGE